MMSLWLWVDNFKCDLRQRKVLKELWAAADSAVDYVGNARADWCYAKSFWKRRQKLSQMILMWLPPRSRIQDTDYAQATFELASADLPNQSL